ncbi:MAG: hypothetical protein IJZ55_08820 [Lachnospiraceae bacterium]|nr:hypothetical protein [Lachnospiraceae bacterium]
MEGWQYVVRELCYIPTLVWLARQDKKYLGISRSGLVVSAVFLVLGGLFAAVPWQSRLGGVAVGILLIVFGVFSGGALGIADAVVITACGVGLGLYEAVALCFFAALYAGGVSAILLLTKKVKRKSRIPFLPFLLLGYGTMRILVCTI